MKDGLEVRRTEFVAERRGVQAQGMNVVGALRVSVFLGFIEVAQRVRSGETVVARANNFGLRFGWITRNFGRIQIIGLIIGHRKIFVARGFATHEVGVSAEITAIGPSAGSE
jgi:hypothetical protein